MSEEIFFEPLQISRRAFVQGGTLFLLSAGCAELPAKNVALAPSLRIGLVTDLHYADKPHVKNRYYGESREKLSEAAEKFTHDKADFIVELGDFIDSTSSVEDDLRNLRAINKALSAAPGEKHYVLGNHCVETLTKKEFLGHVEKEKSYYSFDSGRFHFVILDACDRSDGMPYGRNNSDWTDANVPPEELEWLQADLGSADKKTVVFAHQRLDDAKRYSVKNAKEVRGILEQSGNVQAVFQGHHHRNDHQEIGGIHYCTLTAMVEGSGPSNSGYSMLELQDNGMIRLTGFRQQASYKWEKQNVASNRKSPVSDGAE